MGQPLSHVLMLALQLLCIGHVSSDFTSNFASKPVLTTMVLNSVRPRSWMGLPASLILVGSCSMD